MDNSSKEQEVRLVEILKVHQPASRDELYDRGKCADLMTREELQGYLDHLESLGFVGCYGGRYEIRRRPDEP